MSFNNFDFPYSGKLLMLFIPVGPKYIIEVLGKTNGHL